MGLQAVSKSCDLLMANGLLTTGSLLRASLLLALVSDLASSTKLLEFLGSQWAPGTAEGSSRGELQTNPHRWPGNRLGSRQTPTSRAAAHLVVGDFLALKVHSVLFRTAVLANSLQSGGVCQLVLRLGSPASVGSAGSSLPGVLPRATTFSTGPWAEAILREAQLTWGLAHSTRNGPCSGSLWAGCWFLATSPTSV